MEKQQLAAEYVAKFPSISKSSIAAKLYNDHSHLFNNVEDARTFIRYVSGSMGKFKSQKYKITHTPDLPPTKIKARQFVDLPVSSNNILWMSDLHIPNQDNDAIKLAIDYGTKQKVNCIVLGGDILDNTPFTSHDAPPPSPDDVVEWFEYCTIFLSHLRTKFPKAHIVWLEGNHDNWYMRYLMKKAPMLFNDDYYKLPQRLDLKKFNIDFYDQFVVLRAGKLHMLHGHTIVRGMFAPVNAARGVFIRAKSSMIIGHVHSTSNHSETNIKEEPISCWSTGCLCTLAPDYDPHNTKHNVGFAHILVEKDGNFEVLNKRIINNKIH
ncbi:MAG: Verrucomicrobia phage [Bacteroidota bacterium]|jgi:predicted phosphodiesterase